MPVDWSRYHENFPARALTCKEAANWRCTRCGTRHMEDGTMGSCLTVHHPDRDPENPDARLEALCARCHLRAEAWARKYANELQVSLL